MEELALKSRLSELAEVLSALPKSRTEPGGMGSYVPQQPSSAKSVEDMLDHLRLQVKYLMFDLEATRRENRYLRQMLERRSGLNDTNESI